MSSSRPFGDNERGLGGFDAGRGLRAASQRRDDLALGDGLAFRYQDFAHRRSGRDRKRGEFVNSLAGLQAPSHDDVIGRDRRRRSVVFVPQPASFIGCSRNRQARDCRQWQKSVAHQLHRECPIMAINAILILAPAGERGCQNPRLNPKNRNARPAYLNCRLPPNLKVAPLGCGLICGWAGRLGFGSKRLPAFGADCTTHAEYSRRSAIA